MTKVSVVMLSWDRPDNIEKISEAYENYKQVDEVIIWNNNNSITLEKKFPKQKIINSKEDFNLITRFNACLLTKNSAIIINDDDILLPEETINKLISYWEEDNERIYTLHGRNPTKDNKYAESVEIGKLPSEAEMSLTRAICIDRFMASLFFNDYLDSDFDLSASTGGAEDLFFSYCVYNQTKKKALVVDLPSIELPDYNALSLRNPKHVDHRTNKMRQFQDYYRNSITPSDDIDMTSIDLFLYNLKNEVNFSFARFNDGEMAVIENPNVSWISRGAQNGSVELSTKMKQCLKHEQTNYWKGIPCSTCSGQKRWRALAEEIVNMEYDYLTLAVSMINRNWKYFIENIGEAVQNRRVIWISGEDQDTAALDSLGIHTIFEMPSKDAFSEYGEYSNMYNWFKKDDVVFISSGPLARILACEWFQKRPDVTFIDIGSCFDPFTRDVWHSYHKGTLESCSECN